MAQTRGSLATNWFDHEEAPSGEREPRASAALRSIPGGGPDPLASSGIEPAPQAGTDTVPRGGVPGRRTVTISGRGSERYHSRRRRPTTRPHYRPGFRPDRLAMWAVILGLALVLIATASAHAALLVR